jgi:hypothetical protein
MISSPPNPLRLLALLFPVIVSGPCVVAIIFSSELMNLFVAET